MNDSARQLCKTFLWSECDTENNPLDKRFCLADIEAASVDRLEGEFESFCAKARVALAAAYGDEFMDSDSIEDFCKKPSSHILVLENDFILARNLHGSGFHASSWEDPASTILRNLALTFGPVSATIGGGKLFLVF